MRAVIQRVTRAILTIDNKEKSSIGKGIVVLLGIEKNDSTGDVEWLCNKIVQLRIFDDKEGIMNLSVVESGGEIIIISQFTLLAKTKKGNRPSYINAASPDVAVPLYKKFIESTELIIGKAVGTGEFGARMKVELVNDGPVTILIDTKKKE